MDACRTTFGSTLSSESIWIHICLEASPLGSEQLSKNEKKKGGRGGGTRCPRAVALQLEAGSLSSCCHGDAQVNLTWANSQRHTDARYAIPLFIWFLHGGSYFPATSPPCVGTRLS
ncbi:hypothetical protein HZH66_012129 [Vespula vulgaris]|uniref:Uncharacterized protein n=1 Tax=Vespula vulgaris TaxID=7454 RepID=A0A834JBB6_VESVU|nr:hypothetical protein HZH66_012129 [Vespula vulgaris]